METISKKICEICGKQISESEEEKWLLGFVHKGCKKKEEKKMKDDSETVYKKEKGGNYGSKKNT